MWAQEVVLALLSSRVQRRRGSHAEAMPHFMRQRAYGAEVDAPAPVHVEWFSLGDLETELAHAASAALAHGASSRVAVGHAISGPHPESHNPALDARGIGDAALLQGVVGVAGVFDAVLHESVVS